MRKKRKLDSSIHMPASRDRETEDYRFAVATGFLEMQLSGMDVSENYLGWAVVSFNSRKFNLALLFA